VLGVWSPSVAIELDRKACTSGAPWLDHEALRSRPRADALESYALRRLASCRFERCASPHQHEGSTMHKYMIERDIPEVGTLEREQLRGAAAKSNEALAELAPEIQWVESYVADNKTFCVYLAANEDVIRKHAEISGFPASKITLVKRMIDPTTAE
jgi:hypothetical protein